METFNVRLLSLWDLLLVASLSNKLKLIVLPLFFNKVNSFTSTLIAIIIVWMIGLSHIRVDHSLLSMTKTRIYCLHINSLIWRWTSLSLLHIFLQDPFSNGSLALLCLILCSRGRRIVRFLRLSFFLCKISFTLCFFRN